MTHSQRRIDHLVIAVHDLDAAADFYKRLGFQVGARNRHPWGTENRIVQFGSSFLELITLGSDAGLIPDHATRQFSFGAFLRDYLAQREGLAMLVLDSEDAKADAAAFARAGIGDFEPFFFERAGRKPDGSPSKVAFTLAFASDPGLPQAGFFLCQQHFPEAFWNPAFQSHDNGAINVSRVTLGVSDPADHGDFLSAFTGVTPTSQSYPLDKGGRVHVVPCASSQGFRSFAVAVPDLERVARHLRAQGIAFTAAPDLISISAHDGFGVAIEFESASDH